MRIRPLPVLVASVIIALAATALGGGVGAAAPCPPPPAADTSTARGWIGYLAAHPDDYGLIVTDDGRVTLSHNVDRRLPAASAAKLITLAAFGRAVASGAVDPARTISVNEWERWYLPLDGGAHTQALAYLKLPALRGVPGAGRPTSQRVRLDQLADVMIRFSDSAASDVLRAVLGDARLRVVMARYGLPGPPPDYAGLYLSFLDPGLTTEARQQVAGRRYHDDALYRAVAFTAASTLPVTPTDAQIDNTYPSTARGLNALIRAVATGTFGPGSAQTRAFLEYQGPAADGTVVGFKGGSLGAATNSVLVENLELRSPTGSIATATLLVHRLSSADVAKSNFADQQLLIAAMTDPATAAALRCATSSGHGRPGR